MAGKWAGKLVDSSAGKLVVWWDPKKVGGMVEKMVVVWVVLMVERMAVRMDDQ